MLFFPLYFALWEDNKVQLADGRWGEIYPFSNTKIGDIRRILLFRMYTAGKRSRWMSEDYKFGEFENGFVLSEEDFSESLALPTYFAPRERVGAGICF